MSDLCANCPTRPYRINDSETFQESMYTMNQISIGRYIEQIRLQGFTGRDDMCVMNSSSNSVCLREFEFFSVTELSSAIFFDDVVSGELGLGMDLPSNGPSFVSSMYKAGIIDR